ncbi:GGDEF domain-containing protein [Paenibacillus qinlingensis]|uniref:GGDEF domain-containing protein n=1 Tax=Paenibacillus qinlingensis TaxID=1837343 RepID=UPI001565BC4B|nr:GGDEF domain-containing protein [Paenibacillus qinlingensis]NQX60665.1 GGDEF domain-containing protein [Paenibacillus qinlingensis]
MFTRKWIYVFTVMTFFIAFMINYLYPFSGLWMLFLPPMFGIVVLFPQWLICHTCSLIMPVIRIITQHYAFDGAIPIDFLQRLVSTSIVAWIIIIIFTYYNIRLNEALSKLSMLSVTDNLTQTYNRRYLETFHKELLVKSHKDEDFFFCMALLDIDYFKKINDTYGHSTGDIVLQKVTRTVKNYLKPSDVLIRLGGEEFAIIFPNMTLKEGVELANDIRVQIQESEIHVDFASFHITVSMGIVNSQSEPLEHLLERADKALYLAKSQGRNLVIAV